MSAEARGRLTADDLEGMLPDEIVAAFNALTEAHARCTNLTNAEAHRIFEEAREQRERAEKAESERDAWNDAAGDLTERLYQSATWSARWKAVARRYRALLRTHRDRDRPRLAALDAECAELRAAAVDRFNDQSDWQCAFCLAWSKDSRDAVVHAADCILAAPATDAPGEGRG